MRVPGRGAPKSVYKLFLNFRLTLESPTQADSRRPTATKRRVLRFKLSPVAGDGSLQFVSSQVKCLLKQSNQHALEI